jgi:hypothetical protein
MISLHKFARLAPHYLIDQSVAVAAALWEKLCKFGRASETYSMAP